MFDILSVSLELTLLSQHIINSFLATFDDLLDLTTQDPVSFSARNID